MIKILFVHLSRSFVMERSAHVVLLLLVLLTGSIPLSSANRSTDNNNTTTTTNFTVGFLVDKGGILIRDSVPLAIDVINTNEILPSDYRLSVSVKYAGKPNNVAQMLRWRDEGVAAVIGPGSECVVDAAVAASLNLPIISYGCTESKTSNKELFPTFGRTNPSSEKLSKYVLALLTHYELSDVVLIVGEEELYRQMAEALVKLARDSKTTHVAGVKYTQKGGHLGLNRQWLTDFIDKTVSKTRVFVFLGPPTSLIEFAREMYRKGYTKEDGYLIISVDDDAYDKSRFYQYLLLPREYFYLEHQDKESLSLWINALGERSIIVDAFRSVLIVSPQAYDPAIYQPFIDKMKKAIAVPSSAVSNVQIPVYAAYAYDAVMAYARALNKVILQGGDPRDGKAVWQNIQSSSYISIRGLNLSFDENGDSEDRYVVLAIQRNSELNANNNSFYPIGKFEYNAELELAFSPLDVEGTKWLTSPKSTHEPTFLDANYIPMVVIAVGLCSALIATLATSVIFVYCCRNRKQEILKDQLYQPMID